MIPGDLFRGQLVRLSMLEPEMVARHWVQWERNSTYQRFLDSDSPRLWSAKKIQERHEKGDDADADRQFLFQILASSDDRLVGFIELSIDGWMHGDAWVGIGIGQSADWSKGYGTDAMRLALGYAFTELNLHRVSLCVLDNNPRAIRSYEKAGFRYEGCQRRIVRRDGQCTNIVHMGVLREEWLADRAGQLAYAGGGDG